ncbi:TylF/MycF/NovP-related O-methyltransferase [Desulfosediminicola flagellatus]|uniref:TylF/MycF/NovP-related O-methyltransferase n=1 Tax=Desulfosediminicola flagellatus TaxID=2569541 RepID=UPI001C3E7798|nr:TylF/MycF/NovP-related O-methyltransferase [Desulfosediminicola flagellatus]
MSFLKKIFKKYASTAEKDFYKYMSSGKPGSLSAIDKEILTAVLPYTMTSPERVLALINSVRYLQQNAVAGDFVECGVWKGGSMLAASLTLDSLNIVDKELYLFDTFTGMTEPTESDIDISGMDASDLLKQEDRCQSSNIWCIAGLSEVKKTMDKSDYPRNKIHYVVGDVIETLTTNAPEKISLLRLDTDWYESTKHELEVLFPRLATGGVLIIDDYGHWKGAKKAVDEYFDKNSVEISLHEIDYTGRVAIKL